MLTGISAANIELRKVLTERQFASLPAIVVAPRRSAMLGGTNLRDDWIREIVVAVFAADNQRLAADLATYTLWLQQIAREFNNQRIASVDESLFCTVEPLTNTTDWPSWLVNLYVSGWIIKCRTREVRTN